MATTLKKTLALTAAVCLFSANAFQIDSGSDGSSLVAIACVSAIVLWGVVVAVSRDFRIATGALAWWLSLSIASVVLPLSTTAENSDMGLSNFALLLVGALFAYLGGVLWFALPWDPVVEEVKESNSDASRVG